MPMLEVLSTVQFMYLYRATDIMPKILFKSASIWLLGVYKEILQFCGSSIHSKDWLLVEKTPTEASTTVI